MPATLALLLAALLQSSGTNVEASGEANVVNGDQVAARSAAVTDALKHCVELAMGVTIKSSFSSEQQSTLQANQERYYQNIRDQMEQHSEGFIQHYDVLEEHLQGGVMQVRVRATVYESAVKAEVQKITDLLAAAGNPKLMVVLQETYSEPNGTLRVSTESLLGGYLEQALIARGFPLRGQDAGRKLATQSMQAYDLWMTNPPAAMQAARDAGADMLIVGRVEIKNLGIIEDTGGLDALKGQIRVEIFSMVRGMNTASGEVFSARPVQMKAIGTSEERAVHRAYQGQGANLVTQVLGTLVDDLQTSFKRTADHGQQYVVQLANVQNFRAQGMGFMQALRGINGVSAVTQTSFDGSGILAIDVLCRCSTSELQERIFQATEHAAVLQSLDLSGVSGKRLSFKLPTPAGP